MDARVLRLVIAALAAVCALCVGGEILLSALGKEPPPGLIAIATMCAGALVGILVPSGKPVYIQVDPAGNGDTSAAVRKITT